MLYGGYLSTSQTLPKDTSVQWHAVNLQFDYDSAVKSCNSVNGAIIPFYFRSFAYADVCCQYVDGYYAYIYEFAEGFRKNNALLGRNQLSRGDIVFDIVTTTAKVKASQRFVSSGDTRELDPEGLNQLVGVFI